MQKHPSEARSQMSMNFRFLKSPTSRYLNVKSCTRQHLAKPCARLQELSGRLRRQGWRCWAKQLQGVLLDLAVGRNFRTSVKNIA